MKHLNIDDVKKLYGTLESKYQEARKEIQPTSDSGGKDTYRSPRSLARRRKAAG